MKRPLLGQVTTLLFLLTVASIAKNSANTIFGHNASSITHTIQAGF